MTEIELIVNSRLLIVEILNDTNSPATMLPINLLTLGSTVIMPPNREFNQPDCRRILEQVEKRISGGWGSPWGGGWGIISVMSGAGSGLRVAWRTAVGV